MERGCARGIVDVTFLLMDGGTDGINQLAPNNLVSLYISIRAKWGCSTSLCERLSLGDGWGGGFDL